MLPIVEQDFRPPRPRERMLAFGEDDLTEVELLALVTGSVGSRPALRTAEDLLTAFGDLRALQRADAWELLREGKLGVAGACAVRAAFVLARRASRAVADPESRIRGGADVFERMRGRFSGARKETFTALYLDGRHRVIREERVSEGTLNASIVHPRDVYGPALRSAAAAVVVAHNHPSGDPSPSAEDHAVTMRLAEVGRIVGIALLDHIILGDDRYYSFLERGQIPAAAPSDVA